MRSLPIAFRSAIGVFVPVFSRPVWQHVQVLLPGAVLAPGKRGPHRVGVGGSLMMRAGLSSGHTASQAPHGHALSLPHGYTVPGLLLLGEHCGIVFAAMRVHKTAKTASSPLPVWPPPYTL